ncbi:hypothetical protein INT47_010006 [Mucor saturninus]|uniref:FAD/NAD(P)-binding domain-containing protein n=1 Tax=Mucor saturninus TaxID=64648 RepID=A0A8H7QLN1_9FUNG|nr:hypothetical protein INT47_010006 [Mucor saturninus]
MSVKNIVIVGGGFAGTQLATALEKILTKVNDKEFRIILVEKKTHFYHAIGGLRSAVTDWDNKIMIPYTNLFNNESNLVIQASAIELNKKSITLDRNVPDFGTTLQFDYLILATGTRYPAPAKATALDYDATVEHLVTLRAEIKAAKSIVIVGGGPVGIELAGEIRDVYADTKITVVHNEDSLLNASTPKLRKKCEILLEKGNVNLILSDSVILPTAANSYYHPQDKVVETKSGKSLTDIDLVLLAFGNRPETDWLKNSGLLAENGYVKVKPTFQVDVKGRENIYVLGDAANFNETKMAYRVGGHVTILISNLFDVLVRKKEPTNVYKKAPDAMFITFGKDKGVGLLPILGGIVVGNWVVSKLKSTTLFTANSWRTLKLTEPVV